MAKLAFEWQLKKNKNRPNFRKRDSPLFSISREIRKAITRDSEKKEREGQQFMAREQELSQTNFRQEFSQLNFRQVFSQRKEFSQLNFRQEFSHTIWRKLLANTISKFRVCCKFWRRVLVVEHSHSHSLSLSRFCQLDQPWRAKSFVVFFLLLLIW